MNLIPTLFLVISTLQLSESFFFSSSIVGEFVSYEEIVQWTLEMCEKYSELAKCGAYGSSYENRELRFIKIGAKSSLEKKPEIFIEAGIHAREWLAPATMIWIIDHMLTGYNKEPEITDFLNKFDFIIIPSSNPDGYEFSQTSGNRNWRKTRSKQEWGIYGADPNRNFNDSWAHSGSSNDPRHETYHGRNAFSETETLSMARFINSEKENILAFFAIHCFGQYWLLPYGDISEHYPDNYQELVSFHSH